MGVPALLVDFPPPSSPQHPERARLLGRQWPVFWVVGNNFFRPISTFGIFGYGSTAWFMMQERGGIRGDWRLYGICTLCHLVNVVHSAVNMQPINTKLEALADPKCDGKLLFQAEPLARKWIRGNLVRVAMPLIAGSIALVQTIY
jgi:hypothetical protein